MNRAHKPSPDPASLAAVAKSARQIRRWRAGALAALAVAAVLAGLNLRARRSGPSFLAVGGESAPMSLASGAATVTGAWGQLESEPIIIERPADLLMAVDAGFDGLPAWNFGPTTPAAVSNLLVTVELPAGQRSWLLDQRHWRVEHGTVRIEPPEALVLGLSVRARESIYNHLARIPGNPFKNDPFKLAANRADGWFVDAGLSAETEALIRGLLYPRGPLLCFSDLGLLGNRIPRDERLPVLKALSRLPARQAFLRVPPGAAAAGWLEYWRRGGRVEAMRPLVASLGHAEKGGRVDVSYLLPRFARERLYTFPDPNQLREAEHVDCFWTALNFFRYPPDRMFIDAPSRIRHLEEHYELIRGEPELGDVLVLYDAADRAIHACVYIAGDLVFTKNGATRFAPWVLMAYGEMLPYYSTDGPPARRLYRLRNPPDS